MTNPVLDDIKTTLRLIWENIEENNKQVHYGLLVFIFLIYVLGIFCIILFSVFLPDEFAELKTPMIFSLLGVFMIILFATIKFQKNLNVTPLDDNERINTDNRLFCTLSLFCNYLCLIAKIIVFAIISIYVITIIHTIFEMHVLIGTGYGKIEKFIAFIGTFFLTLEMKELEDTTMTMNKSMNAINTLFNPVTFFRHISTNYVRNWKPHVLVLFNGSILAVLFGLFGVDYKKTCKDTDESYELRIKEQFTTWIVIISLILCASYVFIFLIKLFI